MGNFLRKCFKDFFAGFPTGEAARKLSNMSIPPPIALLKVHRPLLHFKQYEHPQQKLKLKEEVIRGLHTRAYATTFLYFTSKIVLESHPLALSRSCLFL